MIAQLEAHHPETHSQETHHPETHSPETQSLNQRLKKAVEKQKKAATLREAQQDVQDGVQDGIKDGVPDGVPVGCTDYKIVAGKLEPSTQQQMWRTAGTTTVGFGFELTQDADDQQVPAVVG